MAFDKLKRLIGENEVEESTSGSDEYYNVKEGFKDMNQGSKMVLIEPRAYSESQTIADCLKERKAVVVNMKRVTPDQAKRIVDFLSGTLYAIGGDLQKLGNGIFLCTPNNIGVEGKMSSEEKQVKGGKKEPDEYEW